MNLQNPRTRRGALFCTLSSFVNYPAVNGDAAAHLGRTWVVYSSLRTLHDNRLKESRMTPSMSHAEGPNLLKWARVFKKGVIITLDRIHHRFSFVEKLKRSIRMLRVLFECQPGRVDD